MKFHLLLVVALLPMSTGCMMQAVRGIGRPTEYSAKAHSFIVGRDGSIAVLSDRSADDNGRPAWAVYSARLVSLLAEEAPDPSGYCPALTLNFISDSGVRYIAAEEEVSAIPKELPIELQMGKRTDWDDSCSMPTLRYTRGGHEYVLLLNGYSARGGSPLAAAVLQPILFVPAWIADVALMPVYLLVFSGVN